MITFIPAWSENSIQEVSADDLISQIKAFMHSDDSYQLLISNYMPSLRYFLHRYEILESNYWNAFDVLQQATDFEQRKIELKDVFLEDDLYFISSPFEVLARRNGKTITEIRIADGGPISSVTYRNDEEEIQYVDIYDDRGFISSRDIYQNGTKLYTSYFDVFGDWVIQEQATDNSVKVNPINNKLLSKLEYNNIKEIEFELLDYKLKEAPQDNAVVLAMNEFNLEYLKNSAFKSRITASFFNDRLAFNNENKENLSEVLPQINASIVDSDKNFERIKQLSVGIDAIFKISPYDTRFDFGISQEMKEEIIFLDTRNLNSTDTYDVINEILKYIFKSMEKTGDEKEDRQINLTIRGNQADEQELKTMVDKIVNKIAPNMLELLNLINEVEKSENPVDKRFALKKDPKVILFTEVMNGITFETIETDHELMKSLNKARIIVDLAETPDLFTQIAAISTGIPQINRVETEYVEKNKNGVVITNVSQIKKELGHFLDQLKYWQEARAYSAQKILMYSGEALKNYLLKITGE